MNRARRAARQRRIPAMAKRAMAVRIRHAPSGPDLARGAAFCAAGLAGASVPATTSAA
ncbi:MAG: hypothetical protein AB7O84_20040 [Planctomycetota bacterium]